MTYQMAPNPPLLLEESRPIYKRGLERPALSATGVSFPCSAKVRVSLNKVLVNGLSKDPIAVLVEMIHGLRGIKGFHYSFSRPSRRFVEQARLPTWLADY